MGGSFLFLSDAGGSDLPPGRCAMVAKRTLCFFLSGDAAAEAATHGALDERDAAV